MSDSREGRSRQTHPGGLGDGNKLASEHRWWPCSVRFLSAEPKREVARLWLRLLRQKRQLTSLISDENENEFDPFFSLSSFYLRLLFVYLACLLLARTIPTTHVRPCPRGVSFLLSSTPPPSPSNILDLKVQESKDLATEGVNDPEIYRLDYLNKGLTG